MTVRAGLPFALGTPIILSGCNEARYDPRDACHRRVQYSTDWRAPDHGM